MGMSFTYRLKCTGVAIPPLATPARMAQRVDVADWKDVWNVRGSWYDDTVLPRKMGSSERQLVAEVFDPHGVEGFSHTRENRTS
jgi:hypothetical protein